MEYFTAIILIVTLILSIYNHFKDRRVSKEKDKQIKHFARLSRVQSRKVAELTENLEKAVKASKSFEALCLELNTENNRQQFEIQRLNDIIAEVPDEEYEDNSDEELATLIQNAHNVI